MTLKNVNGDTEMIKQVSANALGATLTPLSKQKLQQYGLSNGLEVSKVMRGGKFNRAGIPNGYIIVRINNLDVNSQADVDRIVSNISKQEEKALFISGILPNGKVVYYAVDMN